MSTQLILYPQNYVGYQAEITAAPSPSQFIVDGINFSGINGSDTYEQATDAVGSIITTAPPTIPNAWYRFRTPTLSPPQYPTMISNKLFINLTNGSFSGVYQRMSNLVIGQTYDITADIGALSGSGDFSMFLFKSNGQIQNGGALVGANFILQQLTFAYTFIATVTDPIVMIASRGTSAGNLAIESVSITEAVGFTGELQDGQVICDLYEDENIPLTLSVDDFKNTAEQVQSYSKAFKLPGTKRNNLIFDNIFDITRADDGIVFNPYVKTKSVLKQDGFILFEGYLRLIDIQEKQGEVSYNVNLYSEVVALADMLSDATFSDLGFQELEHSYVKSNIKNSWNDSGTGIAYTNPDTSTFRSDFDTLKYPFVDWNHQMLVANGSTGTTATLGDPELTLLEQGFRPFIQAKYLIDRIFNQDGFPFSYTSAFFDTDEFEKLYMDFNWGEGNEGAAPLRDALTKRETAATNTVIAQSPSWTTIPLSVDNGSTSTSLWNNTIYAFVSDVANLEVNVSFRIQCENKPSPNVDAWTVDMRAVRLNSSNVVTEVFEFSSQTIAVGGSGALTGSFDTILNSTDQIRLQATTFNGDNDIEQSDTTTSYLNVTYNNHAATISSLLRQERGEIPQWDFLKGLITMFNLVSIPDKSNPNNILIEPYNDIFLTNPNTVELDWTTKVDVEEIKLKPLIDLKKKTIFKFVEDDDDYAFNLYKDSVQGHLYGSKLFDASLSAQNLPTILTGEEEIIPEPFAATVIKPLMSQFFDFITPSIYSYNPDDGISEGFANSPRIMYNNGVKTLTSCTYYIPTQNGETFEQMTDFLQFSHLSAIPIVNTIPPAPTDTNDFHFGECQMILSPPNPSVNNLFSLYWQPYFNELYNPDTRTMTLKVNLTSGDLNTFNFFDIVTIKNRQFRVNKIDYKPNSLATVEFILLI